VNLNRRSLVILCLALSLVSPAFAQDPGAGTYTAKCKVCHGADGLGATLVGKMAKIVSFKDPSVINAPDADLIAIVKNGKNKMPAFANKLTDDQIASTIAFIRTLQK
jgi:mono/diheme cytochrome c family protein